MHKRKIVYFRFASHEALIDDYPETISVSLSHRFENFTVDIHNAIEKEGKDVFYVLTAFLSFRLHGRRIL